MRHGTDRGKRVLPVAVSGVLLLIALCLVAPSVLTTGKSTRKGTTIMFETVVVGQLGVNCYILGCPQTKEGIVVDPGAEPERIMAVVNRLGLRITHVINTHGHFDHVGANRRLKEATGATLLIHEADVPFLSRAATTAAAYGLNAADSPPPDRFLTDGEELTCGTIRLKVLHTPGHTPGGCSLYVEQAGMVLTGDTLFADSVGRTDFPGSSHDALVAGIRGKLLTLPEETVVHPGHGPSTTIGREKRHNPYL